MKRHIPYNTRLLLLSLFMLAFWFIGAVPTMQREVGLWRVVRDGQTALWRGQLSSGIALSQEADRLKTGFIGVEWSLLTTTLGSLEAKCTSANPLWASQFLDWFDQLGIKEGDRVVIYSSSSFPALLFSAIAAAESRNLEILLSVSLGSSTWGANREDFPWPRMSQLLLAGGHIKTRPAFYTLGGAGESGKDLSPEIRHMLAAIAEEEGTQLFIPATLEEAVGYKSRLLIDFAPKLFISIGGSNANLGDTADAAEIPAGLLLPKEIGTYAVGGGVIAGALAADIPALNILNIKYLAAASGIPWDPGVFLKMRPKLTLWAALPALACFAAVLTTHRRWRWDDEGDL